MRDKFNSSSRSNSDCRKGHDKPGSTPVAAHLRDEATCAAKTFLGSPADLPPFLAIIHNLVSLHSMGRLAVSAYRDGSIWFSMAGTGLAGSPYFQTSPGFCPGRTEIRATGGFVAHGNQQKSSKGRLPSS